MWRNEAYRLGGAPLPWDADEMIEKAVKAEREACAKVCNDIAYSEDDPTGYKCAEAIRARGQA
jgi:hypothetical protein